MGDVRKHPEQYLCDLAEQLAFESYRNGDKKASFEAFVSQEVYDWVENELDQQVNRQVAFHHKMSSITGKTPPIRRPEYYITPFAELKVKLSND